MEAKRTVIPKPWGREEILYESPGGRAKLIYIDAGARLSLQYHERKSEAVLLVEGRGYLETKPDGPNGPIERERFDAPASAMLIPILPGTVHRMGAVTADEGGEGCVFLEISQGQDTDVVRLEDDYGRTDPSNAKTQRYGPQKGTKGTNLF